MKASSMGFNPVYVEDEPALEQVSALATDAILEFGTPWCGHCQAASPAIEEVLKEQAGLLHIKVYDGKGKALGRAFAVKQWPTLILLRDGREVKRLVRPLHTDEVRQMLAS
ncbi:MAG: thioredoxin 1 [Halioglobus sp.]|jgi:thioredoxin 1